MLYMIIVLAARFSASHSLVVEKLGHETGNRSEEMKKSRTPSKRRRGVSQEAEHNDRMVCGRTRVLLFIMYAFVRGYHSFDPIKIPVLTGGGTPAVGDDGAPLIDQGLSTFYLACCIAVSFLFGAACSVFAGSSGCMSASARTSASRQLPLKASTERFRSPSGPALYRACSLSL